MKIHRNINSFLAEIGLSKSKMNSFYVVCFEEHDVELNYDVYEYAHQFFEISLVIGYDAQVKVNDFQQNIEKHNLICVSPHQHVRWKLEEKRKGAKSYMLLFSPELLNDNELKIFSTYRFFYRYTNSLFQLTKDQIEYLTQCFENMLEEYNQIDGDSETLLTSYLQMMLIYMKRNVSKEQNLLYQHSRVHQVAIQFEQLILSEEMIRKPLSYYADCLHISSVYLSECIRKATNKTFTQIINEYTILRAKSLLQSKQLSVLEIAEKVGFSERSNFAKYFRKHTGSTPKQFQKPR